MTSTDGVNFRVMRLIFGISLERTQSFYAILSLFVSTASVQRNTAVAESLASNLSMRILLSLMAAYSYYTVSLLVNRWNDQSANRRDRLIVAITVVSLVC